MIVVAGWCVGSGVVRCVCERCGATGSQPVPFNSERAEVPNFFQSRLSYAHSFFSLPPYRSPGLCLLTIAKLCVHILSMLHVFFR